MPRKPKNAPSFELSPEALAKVPADATLRFQEFTRVRPNGDVYVIRRATYYDANARKIVPVQSKTIGVIRAGTTEIVPTRPRNYRQIERAKEEERRIREAKAELERKEKEQLSICREIHGAIRMLHRFIDDPRNPARIKVDLGEALIVFMLCALGGNASAEAAADYVSIHAQELQECFPGWKLTSVAAETMRTIATMIKPDEVIEFVSGGIDRNAPLGANGHRILSLDGQVLRASTNSENRGHVVMTLFDCSSKLALRHIRIEDKSNEIPAGPKLIQGLDLWGCVVIADALNTQKELANSIICAGGNYVLPVKKNQPALYEDVRSAFHGHPERINVKKLSTGVELGHGRIEERVYWVLPASCLPYAMRIAWPKLQGGSLIMSATISELKNATVREAQIVEGDESPAPRAPKRREERTEEIRYFISSLPCESTHDLKLLAETIRGHWGIENSLHWKADVLMEQDLIQCKDPSYANFSAALIKHALNTIQRMIAAYAAEGVTMTTAAMLRRLRTPKMIVAELEHLYRSKLGA